MAFVLPLVAMAGSLASAAGGAAAAGTAALAGAGSTIGAIGTGLSTAGGLLSAVMQYGTMNNNAKIADQNAAIAEKNASSASQSAQQKQQQSDNELAAFMGTQKAQQSASGINVDSRTPVLTRMTAAKIGRQDALNIIGQGQNESRNFIQQAADMRDKANELRTGAVASLIGGSLGAVGTALSGTSSLAGRSRSGNGAAWSKWAVNGSAV